MLSMVSLGSGSALSLGFGNIPNFSVPKFYGVGATATATTTTSATTASFPYPANSFLLALVGAESTTAQAARSIKTRLPSILTG